MLKLMLQGFLFSLGLSLVSSMREPREMSQKIHPSKMPQMVTRQDGSERSIQAKRTLSGFGSQRAATVQRAFSQPRARMWVGGPGCPSNRIRSTVPPAGLRLKMSRQLAVSAIRGDQENLSDKKNVIGESQKGLSPQAVCS